MTKLDTRPDQALPERMAFCTPEDRAGVLQGIDDGDSAPLGTALAHARAVHLGPWGDRNMLRTDCAWLLIGELRSAGFAPPSTVYTASGHRVLLLDAVLDSAAFLTTFEHARYDRELADENNIRSALGHEAVHWDAPESTPLHDTILAACVAEELRLDL